MKLIILAAAAAFLITGCNKTAEKIFDKTTSPAASGQFIKYTIQKGNQYCDGNAYRAIETTEMKFVAKFDSTAIYETQSEENQYDINKLYGFSDNNADHHQYSARFGWRWSGGALRLFAYIYNNGVVTSKELTTVNVSEEINCSIKITSTNYLFTVNGITTQLPRMATTEKAEGYQLYPYFGGDEVAPHQINIWIKDVDAAN
ncbi:MAG TPA: hypothetical protein VNT20_01105 [Flavisolibacter sp.]|jgi:hypothetical protein|nr:hypothetical protein [Flavisolibacter sp.]